MIYKVVRFFQRVSDEKRAKRLIKRLYSIPTEEWIGIASIFNDWDFPMKFYDLVPKWWFKKKSFERPMRIISPLMDIVKKEFGEKEHLRYKNVYHGKMTNEEFEYWYSLTRFGNDSEEYHKKRRKVEQIEWWRDDVFEKLSAANVWSSTAQNKTKDD